MSNKIILLSFFSLFLGSILITSCLNERAEPKVQCDEPITYEDQAKEVINRTCAYTGCHDGFHGIDNFKDFAEINTYLNKTANRKNTFKNRVVINEDMPPSNVAGGKELTTEELNILTCWIEEDFPEQ